MLSKEALHSMDYWFDGTMMYSGDADLFLRIAKEWDLLYMHEITAKYREHGSSLSATCIETLLKENEKILSHLIDCYDNFINDYSHEIFKFRSRAKRAVVMAKWKYIDGKSARHMITWELLTSPVISLLYILSFFPFRVVRRASRFIPLKKYFQN